MHYLNQQSMDHLHSNGPGPSLNKKNANNRSEEHWRFSKDEGQKLGGTALYISFYAALQRKSRLTLRKEI